MSKFKVGDKVKIIGSRTEAGKAKIGQVGEILDIDWRDGACFVLYPIGQDWVREEDLVLLATHSDSKREFLERLQSLMREFDADIHYFDGLAMRIGNSYETWSFDTITADTIMDFDKE